MTFTRSNFHVAAIMLMIGCSSSSSRPDPCGGTCLAGQTCSRAGECVSCTESCNDRRCGDDGCGGSCGTCPRNSTKALACTVSGICKCEAACTPSCAGRSCGDDGCGGSCGGCEPGQVCTYDRARSTPFACGPFASADASMSFFVTSVGNGAKGGDFGGLSGADARCAMLAEAAGVRGKTWAAYLSAGTQEARSRIGTGPWFNARGERIVPSACGGTGAPSCVDALHEGGIAAELAITEKGTQLDWANQHDIYTGSDSSGASTGSDCRGWTSSSENDSGTVGHSNALRGGASESWNSAHGTQCDEVGLQCTAGQGHLYCFAR